MTWEQELRARVDEAFGLPPHLQQVAVDELLLAHDRHLRRHQRTLAVLRLLRETNPEVNSPQGDRQAA